MAMNQFYEQFHSKNYGAKQELSNALSTFMLLMVLMLVFGMKQLGMGTIFLVIYLAVVFGTRAFFVEYEYEMTLDEIVISKIMNKKRRKVIGKINVNEVVKVSRNTDKNIGGKFVKACIDGVGKEEQYIYTRVSNKGYCFKVAMDKTLLNMCKRTNPVVFREV